MENTQNIKDLVQKFYPYAKNALGFEHPVRVIMRHDAENAEQSLGKTAYYDPENRVIVLYVTNRHPKDILRSFSHELVHHSQNCRGDLDDMTTQGHYAKDGKGREIEEEAYLQGNLNLRDYEDQLKFEGEDQMNEHYQIAKEDFKKLIAETIKTVLDEKKAKKDYDGDGKIKTSSEEYLGSRDKAIKKAKSLKEADCKAIRAKNDELMEKGTKLDSGRDDMARFYADKHFGEAYNLRKDNEECFPEYFKDKVDEADPDLYKKKEKKPEDDVKEASYDTMTDEEKKKRIEREERMIAAEEERLEKALAYPVRDEADAAYRERAKRTYKRNVEKSEKIIARLKGGKPDPVPANPYPTSGDDSRDAGRDMDGAGNPRPHSRRGYQESKQQETPKEVIKEVKETNKAWYNASLYNKLVSNWTKKGDK